MTGHISDNKLRSLEWGLKAARRSPHTIRQYRHCAVRFSEWLLRDPSDATREEVVRFLSDLQGQYRPATVRHYFNGLRAFFKFLVDEGDIASSPFDKVKAPTVPEVPKDVLTLKEVGDALSALDAQKGLRDAALVSLLIDTGMRASEVVSIRNGDINWEDMTITLSGTKNNDVRVVPFGESTGSRILRWTRGRKDSGEFLFVGSRRRAGLQLTPNGVYQIVNKAFTRLGHPEIGPHDLRHTFATLYLDDPDARLDDLREICGWKSEAMARRYTKQGATRRAIAGHRRSSPLSRI